MVSPRQAPAMFSGGLGPSAANNGIKPIPLNV